MIQTGLLATCGLLYGVLATAPETTPVARAIADARLTRVTTIAVLSGVDAEAGKMAIELATYIGKGGSDGSVRGANGRRAVGCGCVRSTHGHKGTARQGKAWQGQAGRGKARI